MLSDIHSIENEASIDGATGLLVNIRCDDSLSITEFREINEIITSTVDERVEVKSGKSGSEVSVVAA
mgnify:CR=1 FL=1